jgi:glycosyltransferase involved in cell wall biosynthesis
MKIGIDARFLTHPQAGGFKTYTQNLIAALAEVDAENEYVLYLDRTPEPQDRLPSGPNFTTRVVPGSVPLVGMPWREQIGLSRQAALDRLDLLHSPSLTAPLRLACPLVVTIHDMIWYFPDRFSNGHATAGKRKLMQWYYRVVPKMAAQRAAAVITVSQAAKESIVQSLGLTPDRVFVTHEAAASIYKRLDNPEQTEPIKQKYSLASDFILAIGSADPRKNIDTLVQAYASLPEFLKERYQLAIVCVMRTWSLFITRPQCLCFLRVMKVSGYPHWRRWLVALLLWQPTTPPFRRLWGTRLYSRMQKMW